MENLKALVSFVGKRDPYPEGAEEPGPLLSFLCAEAAAGRPFDEAWLLCNGGDFLERGADLERELLSEGLSLRVHRLDFPVKDVIDYSEIWAQLKTTLGRLLGQTASCPRDWTMLLDSGTPHMKTMLLLAARSGDFPARLVQGIPARFAGGAYKSRELDPEALPSVSLPSPRTEAPVLHRLPTTRILHSATSIVLRDEQEKPDAYREACRNAFQVARYDIPVLLLGETGTGKTRIARAIHERSPRASGLFIDINCSAITESLAESELFGHVRGAFSGADKDRAGKFYAAHGGTLFLDEIGDLSLELQAKILKAIEQKTIWPLGADKPRALDIRILAATHRDLGELVRQGRFRQDLLERLKVKVVRLPPLREQPERIASLTRKFMADWNQKYGDDKRLTRQAYDLLISYSWPGNIRELENAITSAACSARGPRLTSLSLPDDIRAQSKNANPHTTRISDTPTESARAQPTVLPAEGINLRARLLQIEWEYYAQALRRTDNNREAAARLLGLTGHSFRKALKERFSAFNDEGPDEGL